MKTIYNSRRPESRQQGRNPVPTRALGLVLLSAAVLMAQPPGGGPPGGGTGATGDGIWRRNAAFGESQTFDYCLGHQPGNGDYHYHVNPVCLRAQLNDNLVALKTSRNGPPGRRSPRDGLTRPFSAGRRMDTRSMAPMATAIRRIRRARCAAWFRAIELRSITTRTSLPTLVASQSHGNFSAADCEPIRTRRQRHVSSGPLPRGL